MFGPFGVASFQSSDIQEWHEMLFVDKWDTKFYLFVLNSYFEKDLNILQNFAISASGSLLEKCWSMLG